MSNSYVFDACALIAFMNNEVGSDKVEELLRSHGRKSYREEGQDKADEAYQRIMKQPISIIDVLEDKVFKIAGRIKANCRLSLADSIVLGIAVAKNAIVVTSDHHELDIVEAKEQITFALEQRECPQMKSQALL